MSQQQTNNADTRTVALLVSAAGGVTGVGGGAHPSADATAMCKFAIQKILDPISDNVVAVHAVDLGLGSGRGAMEVPAPPDAPPPGWFPPVLAAAFPTFRAATAVQVEAGAAASDPHTVEDALVSFLATYTGRLPHLPPPPHHRHGQQQPSTPPAGTAGKVVDLVVVGTRGGGGGGARAMLRRAVMGSVSRYVMDHSCVPVLVVRQRDAQSLGSLSNDDTYAPPPTPPTPPTMTSRTKRRQARLKYRPSRQEGRAHASASASASSPDVAVPGATPESHGHRLDGHRHLHHGTDSWPGNWHLVVSDDSDDSDDSNISDNSDSSDADVDELDADVDDAVDTINSRDDADRREAEAQQEDDEVQGSLATVRLNSTGAGEEEEEEDEEDRGGGAYIDGTGIRVHHDTTATTRTTTSEDDDSCTPTATATARPMTTTAAPPENMNAPRRKRQQQQKPRSGSYPAPGFAPGLGGRGGRAGRGNVICVAHDGGEMGVALVKWTLKKLTRPDDPAPPRALMVVHVVPSSPGALAAELGVPDKGVVSEGPRRT